MNIKDYRERSLDLYQAANNLLEKICFEGPDEGRAILVEKLQKALAGLNEEIYDENVFYYIFASDNTPPGKTPKGFTAERTYDQLETLYHKALKREGEKDLLISDLKAQCRTVKTDALAARDAILCQNDELSQIAFACDGAMHRSASQVRNTIYTLKEVADKITKTCSGPIPGEQEGFPNSSKKEGCHELC